MYKKYLSLIAILILLLNLIPVSAYAASQYTKLGVTKAGDEFAFTTNTDGGSLEEVLFDSGKAEIDGILADDNINNFWIRYPLDDMFKVYKEIETYSVTMKYKGEQDDGVKGNYEKLIGDGASNSHVTNVLDMLLVGIYTSVKATNSAGLANYVNSINAINPDRETSKGVFAKLGDSKDLKSVKEDLIKHVTKATSESSSAMQSEHIAKSYLNNMDIDSMDVNNYDDALNLLVAITWDKIKDNPKYSLIAGKFEMADKTQEELITKVWEDILASSLEPHEQASLYTVLKMRTSIVASNDFKAPMMTGQEENPHAKESAEQTYKEYKDLIVNSFPDDNSATQQRMTFDLRLKYHYYAMQKSGEEEEMKDINDLSNAKSDDGHFFYFNPPKLENNVVMVNEYVSFFNVLSELAFAREFTLDSVMSNITNDNANTDDVIKGAAYLRTLKAGVVFLEGIGDPSLSPYIDYWYKADDKGRSLEKIYQQVVSMGILKNVDENTLDLEEAEPFREYFNLSDGKLSLFLRMGIAQSAKYVPLQTNIYEPYTYADIENDDFFNKFHYIWGYNRKAVYIDTSSRAAVDTYTTGKVGSLRPATLKDFLEGSGDVALYTDTELYNANKLLSLEEQARETVDKAKEKKQEVEEDIAEVQDKWDTAKALVQFDLMKVAGKVFNDAYDAIAPKVTEYAMATKEFLFGSKKKEDDLFLSREDIDKYLHEESYSVLKPFAVTSAIYRDKKTYEFLEKSGTQAIFVASEDLGLISGASYRDKSSIMNYALVQNLRANKLIDYKTTLDYNSPVFVDVYGNITTSSGYVIIPAAANATMYDLYTPYTAAFISTYGEEYKIGSEHSFPDIYDQSEEDKNSRVFELDEEEEFWQFKSLQVDSAVDLNQLATSSSTTMSTLYNLIRMHIDEVGWDSERFVANVLIEVMRGAPMENIDLVAEGIKSDEETSRAGIVQAFKLDELKGALNTKSQNALLALPNPAFIEGIEYVIFYMYKLGLVLGIILIFIQIFVMTMSNNFSIWTIFKLCGTVALTIGFIYLVPKVFEWSYYQTNKAMLQPEAEYISMFNLEKNEAGIEIGVTGISEPESNTELLIKIEDIEIPWVDLFEDVVYSSVGNNLSKIYQNYASMNLSYAEEGVQAIDDGLYMDVQHLYDSSSVVFEPTFQNLYQQTNGDLVGSFYLPYYAILDSLIANINEYNKANDSFSYTTNTYKGGKIKSIGLAKPFLVSDTFMTAEGSDYLHLREMYGLDNNVDVATPFTEDDIAAMQNSLWLDKEYDQEKVTENIELLNEHAQDFVIRNKDLIGRISDETFIKVMAMSLSLEYNKIFGVGTADSMELFNLSHDDLVRLSMATKGEVMEGSTFSYSRFIFETAGQVGIYLAAILEVVLFISGWIKPLITVVMFAILFISIFVYRLILRQETDNVKGVLSTLVYLVFTNVAYAIILKISLFLPSLGIPSSICLIIQIILHIIFILLFVYILSVILRDWVNFGANTITADAIRAKEFISEFRKGKSVEELSENGEGAGWDLYRKKKDADKARKYVILRDEEYLRSEPRTAREGFGQDFGEEARLGKDLDEIERRNQAEARRRDNDEF